VIKIMDDVTNKVNDVLDDIDTIIRGLRKHIDETDREHCREVFRKIFREDE
jgi:hypothetical protein